ncbi:MAG: hypothetical protein KatS3mg105_4815 [Gemmatales bacterium]|nr:MAG: hypothetical protein KatS3mg105_4815 [Gemmatales bacterium]
MRQEIAELVEPIIRYGMRLKEQIAQKDTLNVEAEHASIKAMLLSEGEARRWPAFGGDGQFLGVRYALTCWLDDILEKALPGNATLEQALFGSTQRSSRFWQQAQLANAYPDGDALEGFFWCVMLGFRGDMATKPADLRDWVEQARKRVARNQAKDWSVPPELEVTINVPPLDGRQRLKRMLVALAATAVLLIPMTYFLVRVWLKKAM